MFRHASASLGALPRRNPGFSALSVLQIRSASWGADEGDESRQADVAAARKWALSLKESMIPRAKVRFDRSSGKGGQHVNT
jgi:protein subunit release factor B